MIVATTHAYSTSDKEIGKTKVLEHTKTKHVNVGKQRRQQAKTTKKVK